MMVCKRNFQLRLQLCFFLSVHIHLQGCTLPETKLLLMVQKPGEPVDMEISIRYLQFTWFFLPLKKNKGGQTGFGAFCLDLLGHGG